MENYYIISIVSCFVTLLLTLNLLTSQRFSLGTKVLKNNFTMQTTLSKIGANGSNCINFLQSIIPHKPFKTIKTNRSEGSFYFINRQLKIGKSFDIACAESVISGAHEFAHTIQTGGIWVIFHILQISSFLFLLAMILVGILSGVSPLFLTFTIVFIITFNTGSTPFELDAIISSISLSKLYLKHKGLDKNDLKEFINFAEEKAKATAVWYLLANLLISVYLSTGVIIALILIRLWIIKIK